MEVDPSKGRQRPRSHRKLRYASSSLQVPLLPHAGHRSSHLVASPAPSSASSVALVSPGPGHLSGAGLSQLYSTGHLKGHQWHQTAVAIQPLRHLPAKGHKPCSGWASIHRCPWGIAGTWGPQDLRTSLQPSVLGPCESPILAGSSCSLINPLNSLWASMSACLYVHDV